ncbi:tetratricopeptide repeat protein [Desulfocurvus sp. DL9XJH121]
MRRFALAVLLVLAAALPARAVEDLVLAGSDALYRGDAATAEQALARAVSRDPGDDFAQNQLGLALVGLGRADEARQRFETVARRSPDNVFALTWLGLLAMRADDAPRAVDYFQAVLAVDAENPTALYLLGVEAASRRDLAGAVDLLRRAGRSGRGDPEVQYRLGEAWRGLDMLENARLCYERALDAAPRHYQARVGLGWTLYAQGRRDQAVRAWEQAHALDPERTEARAGLASVLVREAETLLDRGRDDAARQRFSRALVYEPGNRAALYHLRRMPPAE